MYSFGDIECVDSNFAGAFPLGAMVLGFIVSLTLMATLIDLIVRPSRTTGGTATLTPAGGSHDSATAPLLTISTAGSVNDVTDSKMIDLILPPPVSGGRPLPRPPTLIARSPDPLLSSPQSRVFGADLVVLIYFWGGVSAGREGVRHSPFDAHVWLHHPDVLDRRVVAEAGRSTDVRPGSANT